MHSTTGAHRNCVARSCSQLLPMHQFVSTTTRSVLSTTHPNLNRSAPSRRAVSYLPQQQTPRSTTCHAAAPSTTVGVDYDFACPICLTSRLAVTRYPNGTADTQLRCPCCQRTFANEGAYVDLTLTSGAPPRVYGQELSQQSVQLFRNPLVSFVYERGWRQGFASAGFPGADVEFDAAMAYLAPAQGGTLMDLSCGSGLFTRRFVKSSLFAQVIAADFSETMLQQTRQFISEDPAISPESYCLVRCDAARLPFASGSLDAVHAGAAIHCWPQPQVAMAEISRVLRPGGVFVGTTFMGALAPLGEVLGEDAVRPIARVVDPLLDPRRRTGMKAWEEAELQDIIGAAGLVGFSRQRRSRYIMFSARKPGDGGA